MNRRCPRVRGLALALAAVLVGGWGASTSAVAAPLGSSAADAIPATATAPPVPVPAWNLPEDWSVTLTDGGQLLLTWASPQRIRQAGARLAITLDGDLLGYGVVSHDQRSVAVQIRPDQLPANQTWSGLAVSAAGRRLDAASAVSPLATPGSGRASAGPAVGSPIAEDPGQPGPYATSTRIYAVPRIHLAGLRAKVEVRGVVVAPLGTTSPRPLVLFLHGRHSTCYRGKQDTGEWPCPARYQAIPSERGYLKTQRLLASQGYLTVSIAANGINGQDWALADGGAAARSLLIQRHLRLWADWSASKAAHAKAPQAVAKGPRADLSRVLLVGHSRGGEGVNRAALDSSTGPKVPWTIRGLVHIGPTAFGQNPAPGVPVVVLLPYCDGDVSDLQGQAYLDAARDYHDSAFRSAVLVLGANHNYFNAEWTPSKAVAPAWDDWYDPKDKVCGTHAPQRLTAAGERAVGATYTAAAAALFIRHDHSVLPMLDGRSRTARSAGGAAVLASALGGRRTAAVIPSTLAGPGCHDLGQGPTVPDGGVDQEAPDVRSGRWLGSNAALPARVVGSGGAKPDRCRRVLDDCGRIGEAQPGARTRSQRGVEALAAGRCRSGQSRRNVRSSTRRPQRRDRRLAGRLRGRAPSYEQRLRGQDMGAGASARPANPGSQDQRRRSHDDRSGRPAPPLTAR